MTGADTAQPLFSRQRLGFGGAPLGNLFQVVDDTSAEQTLAAAWQRGVRYFDTAPLYGAGLSEQLIGRFLRTKPRDSYVLSSKVGRVLSADATASDSQFGDVQALRCAVQFDYMFRRRLPAAFWQALQHEGLPLPGVPVPASPPTLT